MRHYVLLIAAVAVAIGVIGCEDNKTGPKEDCLCTTEFVQVWITVVDAEGAPVSDIQTRVTIAGTGEILDSSRLYDDPENGRYTIFNDSFKRLVRRAYQFTGEEIRVAGYRDGLVFDEVFLVGVPDSCWCHVAKIAGPDTIRLE
jgi:hypothetical protein